MNKNERFNIIRNIKLDLSEVKKEGFVIPEPKGGEDEQTFVSRCIAAIYDEYGQEQSAAICYQKWRGE